MAEIVLLNRERVTKEVLFLWRMRIAAAMELAETDVKIEVEQVDGGILPIATVADEEIDRYGRDKYERLYEMLYVRMRADMHLRLEALDEPTTYAEATAKEDREAHASEDRVVHTEEEEEESREEESREEESREEESREEESREEESREEESREEESRED